ncbi:HD-GYP domain-containing protein [Treponema phagedenis]|uniref:HD domain protein n=2 Tax=Treponema phagedenis TaxID=162 RepID=A0A0B7GVK5_TREPH|nr:HD-GYP domain-containing protein [Treponema phagedenis]NVP22958.1 HD-GYP domain-containing protein [Treponema phagedenis]QEJ96465.1 HD-GYP domain-containing protein [Treponema phagedenis]QEJ99632.1 HD-GYP domain-containing protein [Treponema phagedenis]QEK02248.1 HD-GYP domain-containing protein [Treponema phagedenis]QEK07836.1 HD-GYP domain-containing protein [Treponema phagedenis]
MNILEFDTPAELEDLELFETPSVNFSDKIDTQINHREILLGNSIDLLSNNHLPMLFLDKDMVVTHITDEAKRLFEGYYVLETKPFFNIFGTIFTQEELHSFFTSLTSPTKGYTWRGTITHKALTKKTLYTETNFIPLFNQGSSPTGFLVLFRDISNIYLQLSKNMLTALLEASKLKDNETGLHNERLNYYCKIMAEYLYQLNIYPQIDKDFIENIACLASMHDVGKIGTPDYILRKNGKLDTIERKIMQEHTINGALVLSSYPSPMAKEIALSHHERWDGNGYPYKLEREMIPLCARIVAIADVYDALRMKRPYKESYSHDFTVNYILAEKDKHFDPALTAAFEKIHIEFDHIWKKFGDNQ